MKKHLFVITVLMMLVAVWLAGCGNVKNTSGVADTSTSAVAVKDSVATEKNETSSASSLPSQTEKNETLISTKVTEPTVQQSTALASEKPTVPKTDLNAKAEQAYMDFLNGKTKLMTSKKFQEDDAKGNFDALIYGEYSYEQLQSAIAEFEGYGSKTKYALLDLGPDGVKELVLRFENTEPGFMHWTGIIRYNGGGLELNYFYEDGGRSFSKFYSSGYLLTGGSMGAGGNLSTLVRFDGKGVGSDVFTQKEFYGIFAGSVVYDLRNDGSGLSEDFSDIAAESELLVREYLADGKVKISVSGWNTKPSVRAREETLIGELVYLGAQQISEAEIKKLFSLEKYEAQELSWREWAVGSQASGGRGDRVDSVISIAYATEELLARPGAFYEFIVEKSEFQVKALFSTEGRVTDVRLLSLDVADVSEDGEVVFNSRELYSLDVLTSKKPLVVGMVFWGDIPSLGISYVDGGGAKRTYAISMSGQDGSLLLSEAKIK